MDFKVKAKELVEQMTVEEKASQLKYDAPAIERLSIPSYNWWNEALHGVARAGTATMFPQAIGMAAMFDKPMMKKVGDIVSTEARAKYNYAHAQGDNDIYKGLTMWCPNINIFRDPRWGRGHETYGEDPYLTAALGIEYVKGMQGQGEFLKTAACAKHYAVHSGPEARRHEFDARVCEKDLYETYLFAFEELVKKANVMSVMGAYNRVNSQPACASEILMKKLSEWGFDGYFVSDCWAIRDFHTHHNVTATAPESAALALKTGCDINCGNTYLHILQALELGLVTEADIDRACQKAMEIRLKLGMGLKTEYDNIPYSVISCDEHKAVSLECAQKSMVLLKNNGILPLANDKNKTIAVIGPNADSREALTGNYEGTADRYITFSEGIAATFEGRVLYSQGCHLYRDRLQGLALPGDRYSEAVACAQNADVVILVVGLDATLEGEEGDTGNEFASGDKLDLLLPKSQRTLISKIMALRKPTVIVSAAGSAINIEAEPDAYIHAWYPGQMGGKALADILFGKVSPSGKLPVTFYQSADLLPDFEDYSMQGRTYRFTRDNILYPFGFGLTYSKVSITNLTYADNKATVTVKNIGSFDTDEVVEIYIKPQSSGQYPRLCGFERVWLLKNEEKTVTIDLSDTAFLEYTDDGKRAVLSDTFELFAGFCQPDELSQKLCGCDVQKIIVSL